MRPFLSNYYASLLFRLRPFDSVWRTAPPGRRCPNPCPQVWQSLPRPIDGQGRLGIMYLLLDNKLFHYSLILEASILVLCWGNHSLSLFHFRTLCFQNSSSPKLSHHKIPQQNRPPKLGDPCSPTPEPALWKTISTASSQHSNPSTRAPSCAQPAAVVLMWLNTPI